MVRVTAFPKTSSMYYRKKKQNLTRAGILKGRRNRRTFSKSLPILHEDVQDIQENFCQIVPINESTDNISCSTITILLDQLPSTSGEARLKSGNSGLNTSPYATNQEIGHLSQCRSSQFGTFSEDEFDSTVQTCLSYSYPVISEQIETAENLMGVSSNCASSERHSDKYIYFNKKILSFIARSKLSNIHADELLKLFRTASKDEVRSLPKTLKSLEEKVIQDKFQFWVIWECGECNRTVTIEGFTLSGKPMSARCCDITLDCNADHAILLSPAEILTKTLPNVWACRQVQKIPEAMKYRYEKLRLNTQYDASITINLDGVAISGSSKNTVWPILAYIDDIGPKATNANIMLFGVWVGRAPKPNFKSFLGPFILAMIQIKENGIKWKYQNNEIISKIFVSKVLCDSMARPPIQQMQQFNGVYGCGYCYHRQSMHYFRHTEHMDLRTDNEHRRICGRADFHVLHDEYLQGITGKSVFLQLDYLDMILDFPPCILHTMFLGVGKWFTTLLLDNNKMPYYLNKDTRHLLNRSLLSIQPPHRISRMPRSLDENKNWKGHEWSLWLLYISPILLQDNLPHAYFTHWQKLVYGFSVLLTDDTTDIHNVNLTNAHNNLEMFSSEIKSLYGENACTFNCHLLRHFVAAARRWGGNLLYCNMAPFESFNNVIRKLVNNSQHIAYQICRRFRRNLVCKEPLSNNLCSRICECKYTGAWRITPQPEQPEGLVVPWTQDEDLTFFSKIVSTCGRKWFSTCYNKSQNLNSNWVFFLDGRLAEIQYFVFIHRTGRWWAVCKIFSYRNTLGFSHICFIRSCIGTDVVSCNELGDIVMRVDYKEKRYICMFLNNVQHISE